MKIYLACDHAGFKLKEEIKKYLIAQNLEVEDCGALEFAADDDYPDFVSLPAIEVSKDESSKGIIFGKSGSGEAIAANKIKGIRAFAGFNEESVRLAREHNDANILSLGSEFVSLEEAKKLVSLFLNTSFSNEERHVRRIKKIKEIENNS